MNIARLNQMADFLDTLELGENQQFDLGTWVCETTPKPPTFLQRVFGRTEPDCGTAACAIGWALERGVFPELVKKRHSRGEWGDAEEERFEPVYVTPDGSYKNWLAVRVFFGLDENAAHFLFSPANYREAVTPKEVAARIRDLIATHKPTLSVVETQAVAS